MSATIPSIASHIHPPVAFTKPSNVPAAPSPSPTIQGTCSQASSFMCSIIYFN